MEQELERRGSDAAAQALTTCQRSGVGAGAGKTERLPLEDSGRQEGWEANTGAHAGTGIEYNGLFGCTLHLLNVKGDKHVKEKGKMYYRSNK